MFPCDAQEAQHHIASVADGVQFTQRVRPTARQGGRRCSRSESGHSPAGKGSWLVVGGECGSSMASAAFVPKVLFADLAVHGGFLVITGITLEASGEVRFRRGARDRRQG